MNLEQSLSRIAKRRRSYLAETGVPIGSILELGAFDNPIFRPELGDSVKYLDWFSRDELIDMHKDNAKRNPSKIVRIDYVVKNHLFARHVDCQFDLISACHVIEHIADVIVWLNQLESLLADNGQIFLAIPDRRYTFDYYRQVSQSVCMLRAHEDRLERPSKWQLAEHFYYHQKVDLEKLWAGEKPPKFHPRFDLATALRMAEQKADSYTDAHCWVFTPPSFRQIMADLYESGFTELVLKHIKGPEKGLNEFWALLERKKKPS